MLQEKADLKGYMLSDSISMTLLKYKSIMMVVVAMG